MEQSEKFKMKFVAYLSGCPSGPKNEHKQALLKNFVKGVAAVGDAAILQSERTMIDCDVAFIQGWVHQQSGNSPHLQVRKQVIEHQKKTGRHVLVADSNLFNYIDANERKTYTRYSLDGVFPTTGNYFRLNPDPARWKKISDTTGIVLKEWRETGNHILICTQRNGGWSMGGLDVPAWLERTVKEIKKYTDRPILVRGHPGDKYHRQYIDSQKYRLSTNKYIWQDFKGAHAVITYNSSPGVAAAIEGIPVFVTDPNPRMSQAYDVANFNLTQIENPQMPDRQKWVESLAMSHWSSNEIASGEAWNHIRRFISNVS